VKSTPVFFFASTNLAAGSSCNEAGQTPQFSGQVTSVAALDATHFVVLTRDATTLTVWDVEKKVATIQINLDLQPMDNDGHTRFHVDPGSGLACASCHPEGGDDGRVWQFDIGPRRTMALRGGLKGTEPFHWSGDESDLSSLMTDVFEQRMGGTLQCQSQVDTLADWMETLKPIPTTVADPDAVDRGRNLFLSAQVGCVSCHNGQQLTNNQTDFVGTGGSFQVPRLVGLAFRAPYLHDGCAKTLADRFGACGGGDSHGHTSQLSPQQIGDLVAFLQTL
jgi:mono/diheme cytochrome c family protein